MTTEITAPVAATTTVGERPTGLNRQILLMEPVRTETSKTGKTGVYMYVRGLGNTWVSLNKRQAHLKELGVGHHDLFEVEGRDKTGVSYKRWYYGTYADSDLNQQLLLAKMGKAAPVAATAQGLEALLQQQG